MSANKDRSFYYLRWWIIDILIDIFALLPESCDLLISAIERKKHGITIVSKKNNGN